MVFVLYHHHCRLLIWVVKEISTKEPVVPGPVVFGVGSRVNAGKAATSVDITFKRCLLLIAQQFTGCTQKNDGGILPQTIVAEIGRILGGIDKEIIVLPQLLYSGQPISNGSMAETHCFGKHQYPWKILKS